MKIKEVAKFEKEDMAKLKQLVMIINSKTTTYDLSGDVVVMVASLLNWAKTLEVKLDGALKRQALEEVKGKVGKVKVMDK